VSGHYFEAMEIPVLRGRSVSEKDGTDSPRVVVISETVARHYWPNGDPVGSRIKLGNARSPWLTVVGVSGDTKNWFFADPEPAAYVPCRQLPQRSMAIYLRTLGDPGLLANSARAQLHNVDRSQPAYDVKSMQQIISEQTSGVRASAISMIVYALISLLLATTGIYAVISYSVAQRTREIGIRVALGAAQGQVLKLVVFQALRMAGLGLAIGIPAALVLIRIMSSVLYNVVAVDWITLGALTSALGASALLAGYIPARRATKVDPMVALRYE
jgi:predicted permease